MKKRLKPLILNSNTRERQLLFPIEEYKKNIIELKDIIISTKLNENLKPNQIRRREQAFSSHHIKILDNELATIYNFFELAECETIWRKESLIRDINKIYRYWKKK